MGSCADPGVLYIQQAAKKTATATLSTKELAEAMANQSMRYSGNSALAGSTFASYQLMKASLWGPVSSKNGNRVELTLQVSGAPMITSKDEGSKLTRASTSLSVPVPYWFTSTVDQQIVGLQIGTKASVGSVGDEIGLLRLSMKATTTHA
jgi:hypothetical protein